LIATTSRSEENNLMISESSQRWQVYSVILTCRWCQLCMPGQKN